MTIRYFNAYAAPMTWGEWTVVAEHLGIVTYTITEAPVGDTVIRCQVRYFDEANSHVIDEWSDEVTITTGNSAAKVEVRFQGIPTGSAIEGTISP